MVINHRAFLVPMVRNPVKKLLEVARTQRTIQ